MKRDDAHARAALAGDPYGVPTGGVPRVKNRMIAALGLCAHGVVAEHCADCSQLGVEMARASEKQIGGDHYRSKAVQPWDAMEAWMTPEQLSGFFLGNVIKYCARYRDKGGRADLLKAQHYLEKLLEVVA